ncbi:Methyltransferase FkbM [Fulvivirga imtechensis AK7]|uniref:Methyltransferase FkbM n=1 Tax=Fulvivirga imtechensis AK7 TaxID=1237149 RepID=L8JVK5_9BACT|nr:FkbM family methyltransferase [Fulvivirga imtechensis]ELR71252.1 Methyltransferase FkbM [Fulvivirga imtechensis AK7]
MNLRAKFKLLFEKTTGLKTYRQLPFGIDPFEDIQLKLKAFEFLNIIDVGANTGQSAKQMRKKFPSAKIYCIEPIKETFLVLKETTNTLNISCHNIALGAENKEIDVKIDALNRDSSMNSIINNNNLPESETKVERVKLCTLASFCKTNHIDRIDYLKIDTEGYDLEVLKGASELLKSTAIAFVETEVSMNPTNKYHEDFIAVKKYLEKYDYLLFGIYEQVQEWQKDLPILRRCNALFIAAEVAKNSGVFKG